jgi:hypothetical protein
MQNPTELQGSWSLSTIQYQDKMDQKQELFLSLDEGGGIYSVGSFRNISSDLR